MTGDTTKKVETYIRSNKKITITIIILLIGAILLAGFFYGNIKESNWRETQRRAYGDYSEAQRERFAYDAVYPVTPGTFVVSSDYYWQVTLINGTTVVQDHGDQMVTFKNGTSLVWDDEGNCFDKPKWYQ